MAERALPVAEKASRWETVALDVSILARIDAAEGDTGTATHRLLTMLASACDDDTRALCHYWLWKLMPDTAEHRDEARRLFTSLHERAPKYEYRRRLEELAGLSGYP